MVIVVPLMLCTGAYRSVNEPWLSTSMRLWFGSVAR